MTQDWTQVPFWSLYKRGKRVGYPTEELLSVYRDHGVIRKSDRDDNWNRPGEDMSAYQLVEPDDLVLNKMKTWQGSLGVSAYRGIVSPAYFVYKPQTDHNSRFMHYALRSDHYINFYASISKGVRPNQWDLQPEQLDVMSVKLPDLPTQQRIADYLDRETGEIDAMIAKMDELAGQLEARRSAVIDGAFVEDFVRSSAAIHLMADVTVGIVIEPSKLYVTAGAGVPALRGVNVAPGKIRAEEMVEISHEGHLRNQKSALREGDLVTVRTGQAGVTAVVPPEWAGANAVDLVITRPRNGLSAQYLYWFLSSSLAKDQMNAETVGAVQSHFNVGGLKRLRLPITRHDEQQRIADHLDEVTSRIDAMLAKVAELKSLLTERRAALITDVVTGRKDVA